MKETTQITQGVQTTQFQKLEKPRSIKIFQWIELLFTVIVFCISLFLNVLLQLKPNDIFFYLILLPIPFLVFSVSFYTQNKKLIKFSVWIAYVLLAISLGLIIYLSIPIYSYFVLGQGKSAPGIIPGVVYFIVMVHVYYLIIDLVTFLLLIITLIFLKKNLRYLEEISYKKTIPIVETIPPIQLPAKPRSIKILQWMYSIFGIVYLGLWYIVIFLDLLDQFEFVKEGTRRTTDSTILIRTSLTIITLLMLLPLFYIIVALVKYRYEWLRNAKFLTKFYLIGTPIVIFVTILYQTAASDSEWGEVVLFVGVLLTIILFPIWLLNLFGKRSLSKILGEFKN